MADSTGDLIDGMHAMRVRQALLIAALRKLGGELHLTRREPHESAEFDIRLSHDDDGIRVALHPAA